MFEYDEIAFRWSASCICLNMMKLPSGGVPVACDLIGGNYLQVECQLNRTKLPSGGVPVVCV